MRNFLRCTMYYVLCTALLGCAKVSVQAPKEPIKVDITMRLDIYQHVQKDIDNIEDFVSGGAKEKVQTKDNQSSLGCLLKVAYAEETQSTGVEQAKLGRKNRYSDIISWESKGVVGENLLGLVEIRNAGAADSSVSQAVKVENSDRMVIYKSIAEKNNIPVEEVQKQYAETMQKNAPAGTPIEVLDESTGAATWKIK